MRDFRTDAHLFEADGFRTCEFCDTRTDGYVRTCCDAGLLADETVAAHEVLRRPLRPPPPTRQENTTRDARQAEMIAWMTATFGEETRAVEERALRFVEEAVELAQAVGLPLHRFMDVLCHVYGKPPGDAAREVGAVGVTLLGLCAVLGVSADGEEKTEVARVLAVDPEEFRRRHATKIEAGIAVQAVEKT